MMKKIRNAYFFIFCLIAIIFSSESIQGNSITLLLPETNTTLNTRILSVSGTTSANITLSLFINNSFVSNTFSSNTDGTFTHTMNLTSDGLKQIVVNGLINGESVTSNQAEIVVDMYPPSITIPTNNAMITSPTFNVIGTSAPNTDVRIFKDTANDKELGNGNTDGNGNYEITIQPEPSDYQGSIDIYASSNILVDLATTIIPKQSDIYTLNLNIPDYPPEITSSTNTSIVTPTFNILGLALSDEAVILIDDNTPSISTTANGTEINGRKIFEFDLTSPITATPLLKEFKVSSNVYGLARESNSIQLSFDVYKPIITSPNNTATVSTPTFNIIGYTEPNASIDILRKITANNYTSIASSTADTNGLFSIMIQPTHIDYDKSDEFIASATVTLPGGNTVKFSETLFINYDIFDYPPTLTGPVSGTLFYTPTFNITGKAKAGSLVSVLQNNIIIGSGTANIGIAENGLKKFSILLQSPQTITEESFSYKVTTNVYDLPRETNSIDLNFDVYNPNIIRPSHNITLTHAVFSLSGYTEPNTVVEIYKNNTLFAVGQSNPSGQFNISTRYDFDELEQQIDGPDPLDFTRKTQNFFASVNVNIIGHGKQQKVSSINTYIFDVPDTRPIINSPVDNSISNSKIIFFNGNTGPEIDVTLYEGVKDIDPVKSKEDGEFEIAYLPACGVVNHPPENLSFKAKSKVYGKDYYSPTINIVRLYDNSTPIIHYPLNNTLIISNRVTFRGESPPSTNILIYSYDINQNDKLLIGSSKSNGKCEWEFEYPINSDKTLSYIAEVEKPSGNAFISLFSDPIRLTTQKSDIEVFIEQPEDYQEIIESKFTIKGISATQSNIEIYIKKNDEGQPFEMENNNFKLISSTTSNDFGLWSTELMTPSNNDYLIIAVSKKGNIQSSSNSVAIKANYDFNNDTFDIIFPTENSVTHRSTVDVFGQAPNGMINLFIDDILNSSFLVTNNNWIKSVTLLEEKSYSVHATMSHNDLNRSSKTHTILRDPTPKIIETSNINSANESFILKGTSRENTVLTITKLEKTLADQYTNSLSKSIIREEERTIATLLSSNTGYWELSTIISHPGNYIFKVYENYNKPNELSSDDYTFDLSVNNLDFNLNLAPNPFNPKKDTLKIEYTLSEASNGELLIFSITGKEVFRRSFTSSELNGAKGRHFIEWNGINNSSTVLPGIYIVLLKATNINEETKIKRLGIKW